jgi:hypothetical protein
MAPAKTVIIVAPTQDTHARVVAAEVIRIGGKAVILDAADFPELWSLTFTVSRIDGSAFSLEFDSQKFSSEEISGVWWRRPSKHRASSDIPETHLRNFAEREAAEAFHGWLLSIGDKVINPIGADWIAGRKLFQLSHAIRAGLNIPKTLSTNSVASAEEFCGQTDAVFKPFTGADWQFIGTTRMDADSGNNLKLVKYAPVIFQEEIHKVADIRVTIVDEQMFPVIIRPRDGVARLDWRIDPRRLYEPYQLPENVQDGLKRFMRALHLRFGAVDLGLTAEGDHYFFEVNPGGQWLFAEIFAEQAISHALAEALLSPKSNSVQ